jgi:hypothetical protein
MGQIVNLTRNQEVLQGFQIETAASFPQSKPPACTR